MISPGLEQVNEYLFLAKIISIENKFIVDILHTHVNSLCIFIHINLFIQVCFTR